MSVALSRRDSTRVHGRILGSAPQAIPAFQLRKLPELAALVLAIMQSARVGAELRGTLRAAGEAPQTLRAAQKAPARRTQSAAASLKPRADAPATAHEALARSEGVRGTRGARGMARSARHDRGGTRAAPAGAVRALGMCARGGRAVPGEGARARTMVSGVTCAISSGDVRSFGRRSYGTIAG